MKSIFLILAVAPFTIARLRYSESILPSLPRTSILIAYAPGNSGAVRDTSACASFPADTSIFAEPSERKLEHEVSSQSQSPAQTVSPVRAEFEIFATTILPLSASRGATGTPTGPDWPLKTVFVREIETPGPLPPPETSNPKLLGELKMCAAPCIGALPFR